MKRTPAAPQLPTVLEPGDASLLEREGSLESLQMESVDATDLQATHMSWDEVRLERMVLTSARLEHLAANDVQLKDCDLTAANCSDSSWLRALIQGGRMSGWDANKSLLKDVEFRGCKLDVANFRFAKLERVGFVDCVLTEADFLGAELRHVSFKACILEKVQFGQAKLSDVDLRTSQLAGIRGWSSMKGAIIDDVQLMAAAPYLANEIGLVVKD